MNKDRDRDYKYVAPLSWLTHGKMPEGSDVIRNDFVIYEVQATAETENMYPAIAQGFNPKIIQSDRQNKHYEDDSFEKSKP